MSAPVQNDDRLNDPRLYAPPWARERPLPAAGQPQSISSPPVASALDDTEPDDSPPGWAPRLPKGVGGPNIECPPGYRPQAEYGGDLAMRALRRRLTLEPDVVPQPPIVLARESGLPWITRLSIVFMAAAVAGFAVAFVANDEVPRFSAAPRVVAAAPSPMPDERHAPARLVVEDGKTRSNEPLPLGVSLKGAAGGEFVMLAGLTPGTRLTAGAPVGSKGWRVMARDLGAVFAHAPRDYVGAMDAAIDLRSAGDALLDSQMVRLEWIPKASNAAPNAAPQAVASVAPVAVAAVVRPPLRQLEPDEIAKLLQRGQQLLRTGDISAARLALRRAAEAGNVDAALGLGATFDPVTLREMGALGFAPNVAEARQWYQKAAELGSSEASRRMSRLQD